MFFFCQKSDGNFHLVCDWRELNRINLKNGACLPNINDLFDTIQGSKYFTKLDLHSSYLQPGWHSRRGCTQNGVHTPLGHFQSIFMDGLWIM